MTRFILQTLTVLLISTILYSIIKIGFINFNRKNYNSIFVQKLEKLKENKDSKKIVLIGGSSVGWGISAKQIEAETGIKTINVGHHAGFGLVDYADFIVDNINPEDIIIFSPEWVFYSNPYFYDTATLDNLIHKNIEYGNLTGNINHQLKALFLYDIKLKDREYYKPNDPYIYNCVNENGDVVSHCKLKKHEPSMYDLNIKTFNANSFLNVYTYLKKAKFLLVFPPTQKRIYDKNRVYFNYFEKELLKANINIAGNVLDNVFAEQEFFDAGFHLTCEARNKRTENLIPYIKKIIAN